MNKLPDPTFDYKLLAYPHEADRFVKYKPTTIENQHKYEIHTDVDLGIDLDFVDIAAWELTNKRFENPMSYHKMSDSKKQKARVEDVKPLNTRKIPTKEANILYNIKGSDENTVPWLKKPEYFTSTKMVNKIPDIIEEVFKQDEDQGDDVTNRFETDPEKVKDEIEQSFEDLASHTFISNPANKEATILEEWDVLPDDELWMNEYILLQHDLSQKNNYQEDAIIKIFGVGHNSNIAAYLIPSDGSAIKEDDTPKEFTWKRHYDVKAEDSKADRMHASENLFFVFDPSTLEHSKADARIKTGVATYNNLSLTVRLQKVSLADEAFDKPEYITVTRLSEIDEETKERRQERIDQIK